MKGNLEARVGNRINGFMSCRGSLWAQPPLHPRRRSLQRSSADRAMPGAGHSRGSALGGLNFLQRVAVESRHPRQELNESITSSTRSVNGKVTIKLWRLSRLDVRQGTDLRTMARLRVMVKVGTCIASCGRRSPEADPRPRVAGGDCCR